MVHVDVGSKTCRAKVRSSDVEAMSFLCNGHRWVNIWVEMHRLTANYNRDGFLRDEKRPGGRGRSGSFNHDSAESDE